MFEVGVQHDFGKNAQATPAPIFPSLKQESRLQGTEQRVQFLSWAHLSEETLKRAEKPSQRVTQGGDPPEGYSNIPGVCTLVKCAPVDMWARILRPLFTF